MLAGIGSTYTRILNGSLNLTQGSYTAQNLGLYINQLMKRCQSARIQVRQTVYISRIICKNAEDHDFPLHQITIGPLAEPKQTKASIELFIHNTAMNESPIIINAQSVSITDAGFRIR